MFRLIFLFIVLGAGLFIGTQYSGQQGYVLISIANKTIEMSVTTLVIFVIAALAILFSLEFALKKLMYASFTTWNYFSVRKARRSRRYTSEGIIKLLEGDWKQAEKKVTRWAQYHDMPLLCYLVASEAAQGMGDKEKRDKYLDLASQQENATLAVELTRAKQLIRDGEHDKAQQTLNTLQPQFPNNGVILALLKGSYLSSGQWQKLLDLLPRLKKEKLVGEEEFDELSLQSESGLLVNIAENKGSEGLIAHWNSLSRKLKSQPKLALCFIEQLIKRKADNEAFTLIKEALKKQSAPELFKLIPELNLTDRHPAIVLLQDALRRDGHNAEAHSAIAQLYLRDEKWEEAQQHFETALSLRSSVSDYVYLADALERQNKTKAAHEVSRKALALMEETHS